MTGPTSSFRPPKTAALIADSIRAEIISGQLGPGSRLPAEAELMVTYGVSRPTLREALRILEHDEIIEIRRGARGGASVRSPGVRPLVRALQDAAVARPGLAGSAAAYDDLTDADLVWLLTAVRRAATRRTGGHRDAVA